MFETTDYLKNYKGQASSGSTLLTPNTTIRLPDLSCRFVMLHVSTTTDGQVADDGAVVADGGVSPGSFVAGFGAGTSLPADAVDGSQVYYGFGSGPGFAGQLFPGDSTPLFPVENLNQIIARSAVDVANVIYWTVFN